jgi:ATP-dependent Clp protease ATP-binding subunit ClpC
VFERFSDGARRVVVGAQEDARSVGHDYIGTEHLLLAMMRSEGAARRLFALFEVPVDEVRAQVLEIVGRGSSTPPNHVPFTPRAKKVLELSLREALHLKEHFIGSEHILLGMLREGQGIGAQVLIERGVTLTGVRDRLGEVDREQPPEDDPAVTAELSEAVGPGTIREDDDMIHVPAEGLPPETGFGEEGDPPVA